MASVWTVVQSAGRTRRAERERRRSGLRERIGDLDAGLLEVASVVPPQPVDHTGVRAGPGGFAQDVGIDQVLQSVSVDSDSMGMKKPLAGQESSQSTSPSLGDGSTRTSR